jgi:hypothetical protein
VFINGAGTVLDAPFGGYKQSGIGREGGPEVLQGFPETKLIVEQGGIPVARKADGAVRPAWLVKSRAPAGAVLGDTTANGAAVPGSSFF